MSYLTLLDLSPGPMSAVLEDPDDDAPRLAYAAAIGDAEPRAQFIRMQCEAARLPKWCPRRRMLEELAQSLRTAHWKTWGRMPDPSWDDRDPYTGPPVSFSRGFVDRVELDAETANGLGLLRDEPVRTLCWRGDAGPLVTANLHSVRELWIDGGPIGPALEASIGSGSFRRIEDLVLWNVVDTNRALDALVRGRALPALRKLRLEAPLDAARLATFVKSGRMENLRALAVRVDDDGVMRALAAGSYPALERLEIHGDVMNEEKRPRISAIAGIDAAALVELEVRALVMRTDGAETVARASLPRLRSFFMFADDVDAEAFAVLASAPWTRALESVWLAGSFRGADASAFVSRLDAPLRSLALMTEDLAGVGDALARGTGVGHLVSLRTSNALSAPDLAAITTAAPNLRAIDFTRRPSDGAVAPVLERAGFERAEGGDGAAAWIWTKLRDK